MIVPDLAVWAWLLLGLSAFVVGVSKTAIPGVNTLSVAVFAAVLPARESTGTLLVLLIVADLFAIVSYRRDANWRALVRLAPAVLVGLVLGAVFLAVANDEWVSRVIGVILLAVVASVTIDRGLSLGFTDFDGRAVTVSAHPGALGAGHASLRIDGRLAPWPLEQSRTAAHLAVV